MDSSAGLQIDRLRLRARGGDALGRRLRTASLLDQGDYRPPGVPPSAILVVRTLQDPFPGRLTITPADVRLNPAWERAVRSRLRTLYDQARRPFAEPVTDSAPAVVFADQAELLACLAMDYTGQHLQNRWWWRAFLRRYPLLPEPEGWARLLSEQAEWVPQVLSLLRTKRSEAAVLDVLTEPQALSVLEAVLEAYHYSGVLRQLTEGITQETRAEGDDTGATPSTGQVFSNETDRPVQPPWAALLHSGFELGRRPRSREALHGISLLLARRPGWIGTRQFREAFRAWWSQAGEPAAGPNRSGRRENGSSRQETLRKSAPDTGPSEISNEKNLRPEDTADSPPGDSPPGATPEAETAGRPEKYRPAGETDAGDDRGAGTGTADSDDLHGQTEMQPQQKQDADESAASPSTDFPGESAGTGEPQQAGTAGDQPLSPDAGKARPGSGMPREEADGTGPDPSGKPVAAETDPAATEQPPQEADGATSDYRLDGNRVSTELAGVLYLVNFIEHLGLPEVFDDDWDFSGRVSPWALLEMIARGVLPDACSDPWEDPLWRLFAVLDGREPGTLPGEDYDGSDEFRLPDRWLASGMREHLLPAYWAWTRSRVAARTTDHIPLLDFPRTDEAPGRQVKNVLERMGYAPDRLSLRRTTYAGPAAIRIAPDEEKRDGSGLVRWLGWALPYLHYRLDLALIGESHPGDERLASLLQCPGDIFVTSSHVDVVIPLDRISLPARLVGLDRDPGWLPMYGRVILFHFE